VQYAKAVKNEVEQEGMRQCHIRDGTALVEYFAWLENEILHGKQVDEVEAADKLEQISRYTVQKGATF
jgi:Xaa-Pro aminopeptidase